MQVFWKLLQLTTFLAVVFSSIRYKWAEGTSSLAVTVVAIFAAFVVTALPIAIYDLLRPLVRKKPVVSSRAQKQISDDLRISR